MKVKYKSLSLLLLLGTAYAIQIKSTAKNQTTAQTCTEFAFFDSLIDSVSAGIKAVKDKLCGCSSCTSSSEGSCTCTCSGCLGEPEYDDKLDDNTDLEETPAEDDGEEEITAEQITDINDGIQYVSESIEDYQEGIQSLISDQVEEKADALDSEPQPLDQIEEDADEGEEDAIPPPPVKPVANFVPG